MKKNILKIKLSFLLFIFYTNSSLIKNFSEFINSEKKKPNLKKKDIIEEILKLSLGENDIFSYLKSKYYNDKNFLSFISLSEELINSQEEESGKKKLEKIINLKNFFINELEKEISNNYKLNLPDEIIEEISMHSDILNSSLLSNDSIKTSILNENKHEDILNFLNSFPEEIKFEIYLKNFLNNPEKKNLSIENLNYLNNLRCEEFKKTYKSSQLLKLITKNYCPNYGFTYFSEYFLSLKDNEKYLLIDFIYRYYIKYFIIKEPSPVEKTTTQYYIFLGSPFSKEFKDFAKSANFLEEIKKNINFKKIFESEKLKKFIKKLQIDQEEIKNQEDFLEILKKTQKKINFLQGHLLRILKLIKIFNKK